MVVIFTLLLLALIAVPAGVFIAWAPVMDPPTIVVIVGCIVLATLAASYLNVRRVQRRVEPILAAAQRTDQTFTSADLRQAIAKVGSFKQSWWTAVAVGAFSLFPLAAFVWDRNYSRETFESYLPLLQVVMFAIGAAFIMRGAYDKISKETPPTSGATSLFITRPRTLTWGAVAVWLAAFMTMSVIGARYEFSDMTKGLRLQAAGDTGGAIESFTKAQAANPAYSAVYIARAAAYKVVSNFDGTLADLSKAIELEPGRAQSYRDRASILSDKKELARAIVDYDKAISIDPKDQLAYFFRGAAHSNNKDSDRAIADFTKALEIRPTDQHAYLQRG